MIDETEKLVLQTFAQTFVCHEVNVIKIKEWTITLVA